MAGKEDPAVGLGSAPAEKVEAEAEGVELTVGVVPSAFMLRPCSGGHAATEEDGEQGEAGLVSSCGLSAGHSQGGKEEMEKGGKEEMEKEAVTGCKRKAEGADGAAAAAGDINPPEIKWVEMPLEYIAWILKEDYHVLTLEDHCLFRSNNPVTISDSSIFTREALDKQRELLLQSQATEEAAREDFLAYQEWIRETFDRNGRVMVPEGFEDPNFRGMQDVIDEEWEKWRHELEMMDAYPQSNGEEDTGLELPSN